MIIVRPTSTSEYLSIVSKHSKLKSLILGIGITDKLTVYDTNKGDTNFEACNDLGALVIPYVSNGSTAVSNVGDLSVYFGIPGHYSGWCIFVRKRIKDFLTINGLKTQIEKNDLTIYGRKFLGYTATVTEQYSTGSIFIAMVNSQELVDAICMKPKTRQTAGLNDYGFTASELIDVIIKATEDYLKVIHYEGGK